MGYKESGSTKSAIAGCGSGALLLLSASLMGSSSMSALGFCLACGALPRRSCDIQYVCKG